MEMSQRVAGFFAIVRYDKRIGTTHICVYVCLCVLQASAGGENPFSVSRAAIMRSCKILGNATYHKCIRDLQACGYITYMPSYHPTLGSMVLLNSFSSLLKQ